MIPSFPESSVSYSIKDMSCQELSYSGVGIGRDINVPCPCVLILHRPVGIRGTQGRVISKMTVFAYIKAEVGIKVAHFSVERRLPGRRVRP